MSDARIPASATSCRARGRQFTETTSKSWLQRIINSFVGVLVGLVLVIASIVGIFWNEGRAIETARALAEGEGAVVSVDAGKVDPANEGKLVHVMGAANATAPLADPQFPVKATGLKLAARGRDVSVAPGGTQRDAQQARRRHGDGDDLHLQPRMERQPQRFQRLPASRKGTPIRRWLSRGANSSPATPSSARSRCRPTSSASSATARASTSIRRRSPGPPRKRRPSRSSTASSTSAPIPPRRRSAISRFPIF